MQSNLNLVAAKFFAVTISILGGIGMSSLWYSPTRAPINLAQGGKDFNNLCARCHSLEVGEMGFGPSLAGLWENASARVPGESAEQYLWQSVIEPAAYQAGEGSMPANLVQIIGAQRMRDVLAYLALETGATSVADLTELPAGIPSAKESEPLILDLAEIEKGKEIFLGKGQCATCHTLNPSHEEDHLAGPNLVGVGLLAKAHLIESIRQPTAQITPGYDAAKCIIDDVLVTGRVVGPIDGAWKILSKNDVGWTIYSEEVDGELMDSEIKKSKVSQMPKYNEDALSDQDLQSLLQFLQTLR